MSAVANGGSLNGIDLTVIALYLIGIVSLGIYAGTKGKKKDTSASYFLAGGTLKWPMIGLALFATNISCFHLVSLAQSGFNNGLLEGNYEFLAITSLLLLGLIFTPFYFRTKISTLPDFLEKRYSKK
ncbi:MAG: sodium:solute symporter, partial [Lentisphaeraceae bacterium]|nr:sodium:solute symporter [Lentisphaeraceae bacterium]